MGLTGMLLLLLAAILGVTSAVTDIKITGHWEGGFNGQFCITLTEELHGWKAHLVFDHEVKSLQVSTADIVETRDNNKEFILKNKDWNKDEQAGQQLCVNFMGTTDGNVDMRGTVFIENIHGSATSSPTQQPPITQPTQQPVQTQQPVTSGPVTSAPVTSAGQTQAPVQTGSSTAKYDYRKALGLSILFYDAQRSGKLPANNPIPWRGDSALGDKGDNGEDLTGGWYDAGDHVKFSLPMSSSAFILAWGLSVWKDGYTAAGQLDQMYDMLRWPLDYFLRCWIPSKEEYYIQVGDGGPDHAYWGRPEDMTMARPAFKLTASKPGSDVSAETAAAFAMGSVVFKDKDPAFSAKLLDAAKTLYDFAKKYQGIYSNSVNQAAGYYRSSHFKDELCTGSAVLYKVTGEAKYLADAKSFNTDEVPWGYSWDDTKIGCQLLLFEVTKDASYSKQVEAFMTSWMAGGAVPYSPCGLAVRDKWGTLRYATNTAFIALMAAHDGINSKAYQQWAEGEIDYVLGDNPKHMSYQIGFGSSYPRSPHHRASSCPDRPAKCDWSAFSSSSPNPQLLKGAMVGGPDATDSYVDKRDDYVKNEVACDYNAGFQSSLAALVSLDASKMLPPAPAAKC
ncbi:endoglucanase E-4-like isoform X1 [Haliotis rufescens]|uniref:endoglucanase E-4-like isoform X1 n=2 Tax=Haliotis rufescens TaxID=6454 RepID=UPI00201EB445|nr:endoglucanase E-4-like isoform X1 [Haliotis rufescens]